MGLIRFFRARTFPAQLLRIKSKGLVEATLPGFPWDQGTAQFLPGWWWNAGWGVRILAAGIAAHSACAMLPTARVAQQWQPRMHSKSEESMAPEGPAAIG